MKFVDLFAGLGGFHLGLTRLGHECVFACDIDKNLAQLYEKNFHIKVAGDIKKIDAKDIPSHDILCAGFPCQPFSQAGKRHGLNDKKRGTLFVDDIVRILEFHNPKYILLENVANIMNHNSKHTWQIIVDALKKLNYDIDFKILSPHEYGIPQIRKRVFIVGSKKGLGAFVWPDSVSQDDLDIRNILDKKPIEKVRYVSKRESYTIDLWQEFLDRIPKKAKLPSFPIWAMEFESTYPFEKKTPYAYTAKELSEYKGAFGISLRDHTKAEQLMLLPNYANNKVSEFPDWKKSFIRQNRIFFQTYHKELKPIVKKLKELPNSWQKLEWNCQGEERNIRNYILQFRASGIRVKRTTFSPSLIASTATQTPIIGWENRYMSKHEAAKLQSMESIEMPPTITAAFRALGNAVNARLVYLVAKNLFNSQIKYESNSFLSARTQIERYSAL